MQLNDNNNNNDSNHLKKISQHYYSNPLPEVSLTAFVLGIIGGISIPFLFKINFWSLPMYIIFISFFHFFEYYITARFQPDKVTVESFVIRNGNAYFFAHSIALIEYLIEYYFYSNFKLNNSFIFNFIKFSGLILTIFGQFLRSGAMITAGESFSHIIAQNKLANHKLITFGIYKYFRHPSYVGFFYWALGTQLLLLNPISTLLFIVLLYKFFSSRIIYEEHKLIEFFGDEYIKYSQTTPVGIPFL